MPTVSKAQRTDLRLKYSCVQRRQLSRPTVLQVSRLAAIVGTVGTGREVLPPDQYVASLARKRIAATALFRDTEGRVLVVNPAYKAT